MPGGAGLGWGRNLLPPTLQAVDMWITVNNLCTFGDNGVYHFRLVRSGLFAITVLTFGACRFPLLMLHVRQMTIRFEG